MYIILQLCFSFLRSTSCSTYLPYYFRQCYWILRLFFAKCPYSKQFSHPCIWYSYHKCWTWVPLPHRYIYCPALWAICLYMDNSLAWSILPFDRNSSKQQHQRGDIFWFRITYRRMRFEYCRCACQSGRWCIFENRREIQYWRYCKSSIWKIVLRWLDDSLIGK